MADILFSIPVDGSEVAVTDVGYVRQLIRSRGADFWCAGMGQGWLKHPSAAELILTFDSHNGFFLEYVDAVHRFWIPRSRADSTKKLVVWVGGNPMILSFQFIVTRDLAIAAVEEFFITGERTSKIEWACQSEENWSYADWDHPDMQPQIEASRRLS